MQDGVQKNEEAQVPTDVVVSTGQKDCEHSEEEHCNRCVLEATRLDNLIDEGFGSISDIRVYCGTENSRHNPVVGHTTQEMVNLSGTLEDAVLNKTVALLYYTTVYRYTTRALCVCVCV